MATDFNGKEYKTKLAIERVENARKTLAVVLNKLEVASQELAWSCQSEGWNEEVQLQIEEAATKLGYALASLTRWFDESEDE